MSLISIIKSSKFVDKSRKSVESELNPWLKKHLRVFRVSRNLHPFFIFHSYSLLGATHFVPTKKS